MLKTLDKSVKIDKTFTKEIRVGIVRTQYHESLNKHLEKHAVETLLAHGVKKENITTMIAPGSWEIPLIAKTAAESRKYDALIAFGIIVKGDTYHFEMIANEVARALMTISLEYAVPVGFEVLAVFDKKQALARASDDNKNKGIEAATAILSALKTIHTIRA